MAGASIPHIIVAMASFVRSIDPPRLQLAPCDVHACAAFHDAQELLVLGCSHHERIRFAAISGRKLVELLLNRVQRKDESMALHRSCPPYHLPPRLRNTASTNMSVVHA